MPFISAWRKGWIRLHSPVLRQGKYWNENKESKSHKQVNIWKSLLSYNLRYHDLNCRTLSPSHDHGKWPIPNLYYHGQELRSLSPEKSTFPEKENSHEICPLQYTQAINYNKTHLRIIGFNWSPFSTNLLENFLPKLSLHSNLNLNTIEKPTN